MSIKSEWRTEPVDWRAAHAPVVVGVNLESASHRAAVEYAIVEAAVSGRPVVLLGVAPGRSLGLARPSYDPDEGWSGGLRQLAEGLRERFPYVDVRVELEVGSDPFDHLLNRSVARGLLVVGSRGRRSLSRVVLGSTSLAVAGWSRVPVVVVPTVWAAQKHLRGPVVVGLDPDHDNGAVLAFATAVAVQREVEVVAVEDASGDPAAALLSESARAQLVVLGRRPPGRFALPLGPVAREVLNRAMTPVAVVPSPRSVPATRAGSPRGLRS